MGPARESTRPLTPDAVLFAEPFDRLDDRLWHEVEVSGQTEYRLVEVDGNSSLKAHSQAGASILLRRVRFDPEEYPWLSWRWRVEQFVEGEDLARKEGSDVPARVYVYFETIGLPWQKRNVDYIWSAMLPVETVLTSLFSDSSKMLVAESGRAQGQWRSETRNLIQDFRRCFGKGPPDVVAIGLMTDTDSTGGDATAYYDDVQLSRMPPAASSSE